ncbi:quinate permease [Colletotrichum abscissum]|uniref:Quinate permease n=2 Tax=Colletotrichum acutatum species complex TaxID=2707335 RepID=A0A9P9XSE5_9PEZI|nr:quinate permease [Colletotrichum costaricense]XP_060396016.1 quinate permease [Colletotrichum abscissum]KAI3545236.1 quinate permease [Colletotrichum filicis]KAI3559274.1 quinate permease [Colletotrichum abscissum]KAK1488703.1 quinate permease [Colletotrichum abscissum]KAK1517981.1 quinate permease [Colletotrichum costaricense]
MGFNLHADGTNDPSEVRNWRIHMIAVIASMSAIAMGYDTSVIGGTMALDSFRRDFDLADSSPTVRDTLQGNIVSTFQAGCFFGALLMFPLAEWLGRKRAIMISALVFLVGGTLMTASHGEIGLLIAGRAIAGLGIGATSLIVPVYISEISPPSIRGRLVGLFEIASQGGGMCGFWVNYAVDRTISDSTQTQWIVPLGLQLLPGVLLFFGIFVCPESPRWLAKNDRWEDATRVLVHVRELPADHDYVSTEISDIKRQVEDGSANRMSKSQMFKRLFEKGSRNRIGIGLLLMACQNLTGVNIITYYSPRIFETLGITGTSTKLFATGFYGIAKTLGMVIFTVWLAEKVGRRNGLIWGAFVGSLPMWYIGGFTFLADPAGQAAAGNTDRNAWGYIAMVCVYLYGLIYCATWQGITWLYCSEVFSLDIRMLCVAITTADQWLWSFIVSRTTPYMITSLGYGTYMFFGALMILMGVWAFFFVPETKGLTLEDMDLLFMRSMHTTVWTALRERKSVKDVLANTSPAAVYATGSEEKEIRLEYVDTVEDKSVAR